ncbi:hypothetical protein BH160DRAFT_6119 [Burkholderia sp. H160]|nr:hypothetical protein BH160DRAFT_6119 [Burkholderia sp. H160]
MQQQTAASVADRDIVIGPADQVFPSALLSDERSQLVTRLNPVPRPMNIALQLQISHITERVDAAHQLVKHREALGLVFFAEAMRCKVRHNLPGSEKRTSSLWRWRDGNELFQLRLVFSQQA